MSPKKIEKLKEEAMAAVEENSKLTQVMVDKIFSFSELGFQEVETSKYITGILEENGFTIERGISGVPTAWTATWGSGKPVIAIGSDLDCIPKASQKPGVAYHDPIIEGAPGHGEGHNSGQAVNVTAVLAVKDIMEREGLPGTLMLWPGVAEEQVATKAFFVRDGYFDDVDACIFTHVGNNLETSYGSPRGNGMISVEFSFDGEAAHGAGSPWRGRSSLDAVELMNVGWNFRREHLQPTQRSHYVITDGGDQPNVVPAKASVWYYLRDRTYSDIKKMYDIAINIAKGAAMMTDTEMSYRYLGSAWPGHFNKVIAETAHKNIEKVGLPEWSEDDQTLAKAVQEEVGSDPEGLATELEELGQPVKFSLGGGSDDIADISWAVPTIVLRFPSNMPGLQGHHWSNAITMATPIAHKGATAGAKAEAMTLLDLFLKPELIEEAWTYYKDEQTKDVEYEPLLNPDDKPAIELNQEIMATFRPELEKYYFDETKYDTYLEQLGIEYPTLRSDAASVDSESERK
ncbi:MAG: amidohydrolase [Tunicatimonas sp.]